MPHGAGYGNAGVADFLCCVNGHFLAIEAKAKGGKLTALQEKNSQEVQKANGISLVIDEEALASELLERTLNSLKDLR